MFLRASGFPDGSDGRESACSAGDLGSVPGSGRSPAAGHGNPFQYSCLENPVDRGAWWATAHGVAESDTTEQVSTQHGASLSTLHRTPSAQALCQSPQPCSRLPTVTIPEKGTPQSVTTGPSPAPTHCHLQTCSQQHPACGAGAPRAGDSGPATAGQKASLH